METKISNLSVIYILWLRQIKQHFRSKSRLVGSIGQPLLFLVALGFGFGPIYQRAGGGNYLEFLAPGIISMSIMFSSVFSGIGLIYDKQFGFLKETLVAPVPRITIFFGRILGGATVAVFQGVVVLFISMLFGFRFHSFVGFLMSLAIMFLIALFFTSLGTTIATKLSDMHAFPIIMNFIIMPIFFLSGALFPLDNLPGTIGVITIFNPLSYGVDGIRGLLVDQFHFGIFRDMLVLSGSFGLCLILGSKLFSKIEV